MNGFVPQESDSIIFPSTYLWSLHGFGFFSEESLNIWKKERREKLPNWKSDQKVQKVIGGGFVFWCNRRTRSKVLDETRFYLCVSVIAKIKMIIFFSILNKGWLPFSIWRRAQLQRSACASLFPQWLFKLKEQHLPDFFLLGMYRWKTDNPVVKRPNLGLITPNSVSAAVTKKSMKADGKRVPFVPGKSRDHWSLPISERKCRFFFFLNQATSLAFQTALLTHVHNGCKRVFLVKRMKWMCSMECPVPWVTIGKNV